MVELLRTFVYPQSTAYCKRPVLEVLEHDLSKIVMSFMNKTRLCMYEWGRSVQVVLCSDSPEQGTTRSVAICQADSIGDMPYSILMSVSIQGCRIAIYHLVTLLAVV